MGIHDPTRPLEYPYMHSHKEVDSQYRPRAPAIDAVDSAAGVACVNAAVAAAVSAHAAITRKGLTVIELAALSLRVQYAAAVASLLRVGVGVSSALGCYAAVDHALVRQSVTHR